MLPCYNYLVASDLHKMILAYAILEMELVLRIAFVLAILVILAFVVKFLYVLASWQTIQVYATLALVQETIHAYAIVVGKEVTAPPIIVMR